MKDVFLLMWASGLLSLFLISEEGHTVECFWTTVSFNDFSHVFERLKIWRMSKLWGVDFSTQVDPECWCSIEPYTFYRSCPYIFLEESETQRVIWLIGEIGLIPMCSLFFSLRPFFSATIINCPFFSPRERPMYT